MDNTSEFLNKLDELSLELKKLSNRDKNSQKEIAKNALDNVDNIDKTIYAIYQLIKEKDILADKNQFLTNKNHVFSLMGKNQNGFKMRIEIEALKCYKDKLLNSRKEWLLVAEANLEKNKIKAI